jgi:hypothetical protein
MKKTYVKTLFFNGIQNKLGKGLLQNLVKEFPNLKTIITVCDGEKIVFEGIEVVNLNYREILYGIYEGIDDLIEVDELDFSRYKDSFFDAYKMLDRLHSLFSLNDRNKINILLSHIKYWENINKKFKVDLALYMNVPHEIFDYISFVSFKKRGVKTIHYYQINFEYLYSINENLEFKTQNWRKDTTLSESKIKNSLLNHSYQNWIKGDYKPFYMDVQNFENEDSGNLLKIISQKLNNFIEFRKKYLELGYLDIDYLHFFISKKIILNFKSSFFLKHNEVVPDLNKKYVFIPLNYQPEATTSPYGGYYVFQDKMIGLISESIPSDWVIYVKEHPKQIKYFARDYNFYSKLLNKKNVKFVKNTHSSFELLNNAQFVATVTGTLGIQSFCNLKPVLLFGECFFKDAPGVFRINDSENLKKVINKIIEGRVKISTSDVKKYFNHLGEKYFFGFSDFDYGPYSNLNWSENLDQLISNTIKFLEN